VEGQNNVEFDLSAIKSGTYLIQLKTENKTENTKVIIP
ncbi:T9SS type A sorting domain-containing protein, partial [Fulvivirga sediminis]|nr:T9SS type A sorting domain-containing protein [Fulvivirga sediminis]MBL3659099.1 T9SS type A sorting domain-containing protein [Fulvivirga sediminis]